MFDDLIGVPYLPGGRTIAGLDCWGLVLVCCARVGIPVSDTQGWTDQDAARAQQGGLPPDVWIQERFPDWERLDVADRGAVAVFLNIDGAAVHAGFVVDAGHFLHMSKKLGAVRTRLSRAPFSTSLCGIYRYRPGLTRG